MSLKPRNIILAALLLLIVAGLGGMWLRMELEARKWTRQLDRQQSNEPVSEQIRDLTLIEALGLDRVSGKISGPADGPLNVRMENTTRRVLKIEIPAGQLFLSHGRDAEAILLQGQRVILKAQEARDVELPVVPASLLNAPGAKTWRASLRRDEALEPLVRHLAAGSEPLDPELLRAAVLIARENLPLAALADFPLLTQERPAEALAPPRPIATPDLAAALLLLRDAGYAVENFAILVDPQFRLETMLDPEARPIAQEIFRIHGRKEWVFWKNQLEHGHDNIRHRALLGIARYFPEVALQMLPDWARFERISFRFRQAALLGLAEMGTPESGALLNKLRWEFRNGHLLENAAIEALAMHEHYRDEPLVPRISRPVTRPVSKPAATALADNTRQDNPPQDPPLASASASAQAKDKPTRPATQPDLLAKAEAPAPRQKAKPVPQEEPAPAETGEEMDLVSLAEMYATGETPEEITAPPQEEPESSHLAKTDAGETQGVTTDNAESTAALDIAGNSGEPQEPAAAEEEAEDTIDLVAFAEALASGGTLPESAEQFLSDESSATETIVEAPGEVSLNPEPGTGPSLLYPPVEQTSTTATNPEDAVLEILGESAPEDKSPMPAPEPSAEARYHSPVPLPGAGPALESDKILNPVESG